MVVASLHFKRDQPKPSKSGATTPVPNLAPGSIGPVPLLPGIFFEGAILPPPPPARLLARAVACRAGGGF